MVERDLEGDAAAQRVADEVAAADPMLAKRIEQGLGKQLERIVGLGLGRGAIADEVGQDDAIARIGEHLRIVAEVGRARRAGTAAMDEDDDGRIGWRARNFRDRNLIAARNIVALADQFTAHGQSSFFACARCR